MDPGDQHRYGSSSALMFASTSPARFRFIFSSTGSAAIFAIKFCGVSYSISRSSFV